MISNKFRIPGYILTGAGIFFAVLYFTIKFRFELPVFAVASSYLKTKYFTTFSTNFSDEMIFILLLAGLSLVVFSREKEESVIVENLRKKALTKTLAADIIFLFFTVIFIYGSGFLVAIIINVFLPFGLYLLFFNLMKIKAKGSV
jgi:hypothetical protein